MATNFALSTSSTDQQIIQSLNYALANMNTATVNYDGNVLVANTATGSVSSVYSNGAIHTQNINYLYGYVDIMYSNSATGSSGFTSNSFHANYYGVHNTDSAIQSNNPVDYQWIQVAGGFGTNSLWYTTSGGGKINFIIGNAQPGTHYYKVIDNTPILLANLANAIVTNESISPNAITADKIVANTITGDKIAANTIQATSIVAQSLTATQILNVGNIVSTGATLGSYSGTGYWADWIHGDTYFGGNTRIGNYLQVGSNALVGANLTVGANLNVGGNARIGANLYVQDLITLGSLNANTVGTTTIVPGSVVGVSSNIATNTNLYTSPAVSTNYDYTWSKPIVDFLDATVPAIIQGVLTVQAAITPVASQFHTANFNLWRYPSDSFGAPTGSAVLVHTTQDSFVCPSGGTYYKNIPFLFPDSGISGYYVYYMSVVITSAASDYTSLTVGPGTLTAMVAKR